MVEQIERIKTYIQGFDEALQGGVPKGHVTLVSGSSGSMKSSICFNILFNEALKGQTGLYISLEQSYESLYKHFMNMGLRLDDINLVSIKDLAKIGEEINTVQSANKGLKFPYPQGK